MKLFISWSGDTSHKIAVILRDWIPYVLQSVNPYVSSEDIDKGTRWSSDIAKELEESRYGIICVTHENLRAPWVNFEAGALSKTIESTNVAPFLFDIKKSDVEGPLVQFQLTIYEKEDVRKLISSINKASDGLKLDQSKLDIIFEQWWPQLKEKLDSLADECKKNEDVQKINTPIITQSANEKILEELLELSRLQVKILKNPEELIPPGYFKELNRKYSKEYGVPSTHPVWRDLDESYSEFKKAVAWINTDDTEVPQEESSSLADLLLAYKRMRGPLEYLLERYGRTWRRLKI